MHPSSHRAYYERDLNICVVLNLNLSVVQATLLEISTSQPIEFTCTEGDEGGHFNHTT